MIKVLVTGASGFAGHHLIKLLLKGDYKIWAGVYGDPFAIIDPKITSMPLNLVDKASVDKAIEEVKPDWVFHLAALTSPAVSFKDNNKTLLDNIVLQANLLDALVNQAPEARVLVVGSAEEYGKVLDEDLPINELCNFRPMSPYGISKITQDMMGLQYFLSYGLPVIRVRPFNHVGEGQTTKFVLPAFAEQIAKIEAGLQDPIMKVGNLTTRRDFTDVLDMVAAYELALLKGIPGEVYNLGSGVDTSIQSLLDTLLSLASVKIEIVQDPDRMLPSDVPVLKADSTKFNQLTGWKTSIPLSDTIARVLDYWRAQIKKI